MRTISCIYCNVPIVLGDGQGDHVIPESLGRFNGALIFRGICVTCNSITGHCEQQITQSGPESLFLRIVAPRGRRNSGPRGWVGAKGAKPPVTHVLRNDYVVLAIPTAVDKLEWSIPEQLVFIASDGNPRVVRLNLQMSGEAIRTALRRNGYVVGTPIRMEAEVQNWESYIARMREFSPDIEAMPDETIAGKYRAPTRTRFVFGGDYFRAFAKIAFHYYLTQNRRGLLGHESEFAGIRQFIMSGGNHEDFFVEDGPRILLPLGPTRDGAAILPAEWCHLLAAVDEGDETVVSLSLFAGPLRSPRNDHIRLSPKKSRLWIPSGRRAHCYRYVPRGSSEGFDGEVSELGVSRMR